MSATFKLDILTPTKSAFSGFVSQAVIPGSEGEIGILPGHRDLIGLLGTGSLKFETAGGPTAYMVSSGFYEVKNGDLSVLCEVAEAAAEIDAAAAALRTKELKERLDTLSGYADEFGAVKQALAVEEARVSAAKVA